MGKYLEEDLNIIASSEYAKDLKEKNILVTGATGLVGSLIVRSLLKIGANVYILVRNQDKAKGIYGDLLKQITVIVGDITNTDCLQGISCGIDYVFHCAAITSSKVMINQPVETIETAIVGTNNLLRFSVQHHVKTFLYISSMEMYGNIKDKAATEDTLGFIDISKVRSDYPESKRMCENLCIGYMAEFGLNIKIARLAQTFGPGILPWEGRVFAQFAKSVIEKENIVLHTKGKSEGNYCYTRDMVLGLLTILFKGENGNAYNVVNEELHMTIAEMAELVAHDVARDKIHVVFNIPSENSYGYAPDTKLKLSGHKLELLGWKPKVDMKNMYIRMIRDMKEDEL